MHGLVKNNQDMHRARADRVGLDLSGSFCFLSPLIRVRLDGLRKSGGSGSREGEGWKKVGLAGQGLDDSDRRIRRKYDSQVVLER